MGELFSNLGINGKLLFAQALNFLLVLWLLNRFVFKKLISHLEDRKGRISQGLELGERAKREMERIGQARHRELAEAKAQADAVLREARLSASKSGKEAMAQVRTEAEKMLIRAKGDAKKAKEDTIKDAKEEINKIAVLVAEKVLSRSLTKEDQERAAHEVLQYLEKDYAK